MIKYLAITFFALMDIAAAQTVQTVTGASGDVANAPAIATLAPFSTSTSGAQSFTCLSGFEITGSGATKSTDVVAKITGLNGAPVSYVIRVPAGNNSDFGGGNDVGLPPFIIQFNPALMSSTFNTPITLTLPAFGSGNKHAAVVVHGYYGGLAGCH
jgi:hypothetical protein